MPKRDRTRKGVWKGIRLLAGVLALVAVVSACAEVEQRYEKWLDNLRPEKQIDPRGEAIRACHYRGLKDEIFFGKPKISPPVARPGDRVTLELPFAVLAPSKKTVFSVVEVVTLSGEDVRIELSKRESERHQGAHISALQFVIPKDLPRGEYRLTTTINANDATKSQIGRFSVEGADE